MEKNIIVTDVEGNHIGTTYPKRARGLVKNGRAEYVSDREIRLKNTRAPAVYTYTEDTKMSKIINFNTRDFKFEDTCKSNVGFRGFVSTGFGNEEIWEIGDWGWNWTQIAAVFKGLEKNTDYVFRFAMTLGHNDDNREESLVHILRDCEGAAVDQASQYDIEEESRKAWEDRYTYCIRQSRFKPVISKRDREEDTMLRVFELPFNTGDHNNWKVIIVANHAIARFFRAKENEVYSGLEDLRYEQWREQRTARLYAEREQEKLAKLEAARRVSSAGHFSGNEFNSDKFGAGEEAGRENSKNSLGSLKLNASIIHDPEIMEKLISLVKMGLNVELSGTTVGNRDEEGSDEEYDEEINIEEDFDEEFDEESDEDDEPEEDEDDTSEESDDYEESQYSRCEMTEEQFAYFLAGCEDGRVYSFKDFTVTPGSADNVNVNIGRPLDGWMISFTDATMTASAFSMLISKIGDGCFMKFNNFTVTGTGMDRLFVYDGMKADGFAVQLKDTTIPRKLVEMLNARKGDGCSVSLKDVQIVG